MGKGSELFEELYKSHYAMVLQLCLGFLKGQRESARDLAHETFLNVWHAFDRFKGNSSARTWIYRIAVNTCLKYIRDQKIKHPVSLHEEYQIYEDPEESVEHEYRKLYQAIGQLREIDRLIIMMVLDELTYKEIASVVGISEANLRVKIHRIKSQLKKVLAHE
jgi:RNA polymerase sigma-70 factor (ECF subfamily)